MEGDDRGLPPPASSQTAGQPPASYQPASGAFDSNARLATHAQCAPQDYLCVGALRVRVEGGVLICRSVRRSNELGSTHGSEHGGTHGSEHSNERGMSANKADEQQAEEEEELQNRPRCCLPLDRDCTLPCPVGDSHRKARMCVRGVLSLNGSVCLPPECQQRPRTASLAACGTRTTTVAETTMPALDATSVLGTAQGSSATTSLSLLRAAPALRRGRTPPSLQCCAAHIRRHGPLCCGGGETGCAVPHCTRRPSELCASGIRALGGRVCLPFRCRVDDPTYCSERSPFPPSRESEWTPGKRPPRTCCAEALLLFFAQADARRAKASAAELERAGNDEFLQQHDCCYPTDTACRLPSV